MPYLYTSHIETCIHHNKETLSYKELLESKELYTSIEELSQLASSLITDLGVKHSLNELSLTNGQFLLKRKEFSIGILIEARTIAENPLFSTSRLASQKIL